MSRLKIVSGCMAMVLLVVSLGAPLMAQDATATPADTTGQTGMMTNCDSSLVLLAGLAHRYFGYTGAPDLDLSTFEYGQYTPLFDMSGMSMGGTEPGMSATMEATAEVMMTTEAPSGAETMATPMVSSVFLNPPLLTDENPSCAQLRASLDLFFNTEFQRPDWDTRFRGGMGGMTDSNG